MVARRPASSPAAASTKAPEQSESTRAPRAWARRSARQSGAGTGSVAPRQPGTTIVPARASSAAPPSTSTLSPPAARSGPGSSEATPKRYQCGPISGRGRPKTSAATPNSKVQSLS